MRRLEAHLCRRAGARVRGEKRHAGTYGPILPQLNRLKVHHLTLEFTAAGADDLESLGRLRPAFELGLGVVDVTPGAKEEAPRIVERIERALKRVDAKRIRLSGFAPGSAAKVDIDEVFRKLPARRVATKIGAYFVGRLDRILDTLGGVLLVITNFGSQRTRVSFCYRL